MVRFIFWAVSPLCVRRVCARACPAALPQGRGGVSECVELVWDFRAEKQLQSKARPRAPVVTELSLASGQPQQWKGVRLMLTALRRVVGVPYDYVTALLVRHDIWGFLFWFWFLFLFLEGLNAWRPPTQWQYETLCASLQPLPCVHLSPVPPFQVTFLLPLPPFACLSSAFRQLRHSSVWTVTDSCTRDQLTRFTISRPVAPASHLQPHFCMRIRCLECFLTRGAEFLALASSMWSNEREENLHQKLVLCSKLSFCFVSVSFGFFVLFCFGLSVQDLQLLKSALPLIKPCSLQPDLCIDGFFSTLKENPT